MPKWEDKLRYEYIKAAEIDILKAGKFNVTHNPWWEVYARKILNR